MICKLSALLPPLLLGLLAAPVPGRQASGRAASWPAGRPAAPPDSGRYASVRGTVRLARTNRPLAGVLLAIESCSFGYFGATGFAFTGDSTRTDAQGRYELRFHPQADKQYVVRLNPGVGRPFGQPSRFVFTTKADVDWPNKMDYVWEVRPDTVTTADFAPDFAPNYSRPIELHLPAVGH